MTDIRALTRQATAMTELIENMNLALNNAGMPPITIEDSKELSLFTFLSGITGSDVFFVHRADDNLLKFGIGPIHPHQPNYSSQQTVAKQMEASLKAFELAVPSYSNFYRAGIIHTRELSVYRLLRDLSIHGVGVKAKNSKIKGKAIHLILNDIGPKP